jgi:hypothetical protein
LLAQGWVTDENPFERARRTESKHNFQCPIDEADAMARVLDPVRPSVSLLLLLSDEEGLQVFMGVNTGARIYGKFLKDFVETEW